MAEISTIARPYAEAVFRAVSTSGGDLNAWAGLLAEMASVAAHPDMRALVADPKLSATQVYDVFTGVLKSPLDDKARNFVRDLVAHGRMTALPEISAQFRALKNAKEGAADAEIVSAFPLSDAQVAELLGTLERKFKAKLKPVVKVDASLIGGVRVVVGDEVFDTSVRSRLEQMRAALVA